MSFLPENFKKVIKIDLSDREVDKINEMLFSKIKEAIPLNVSMMEKSAMEDEVTDWLEEHESGEVDALVEAFVDYGIGVEELEQVRSSIRSEDFVPIIHWMGQVLTTEKLVNEIEDSSQRINELVCSVKHYTHMDQAPEQQVADIHKGIHNTLKMLHHKIKKYQIEVEKSFDTSIREPKIFVSEMNQVWTNLIDNAIDAMKGVDHRRLTMETAQEGDYIRILVQDSGTGIPDEIMDKIYDPFFTTKSIGEGTGLGLDVVRQIVNQHNGTIEIRSRPGETAFTVRIPI